MHANAFSPKASLVYSPNDDLTLRASFGKGFRAPDIFTLYSSNEFFGSITTPSTNLKPEESTAGELSTELRLPTDTKLTARVYESLLTNFLDYNCATNTITFQTQCSTFNAQSATVRGVALGITQKITDNWSVYGNFTRTWSRMDDDTLDPLANGKQLSFTPNYMANAGLKYVNGDWSGTVNVRYASKVFATVENTDTASGYPGFYDAYAVVDAKISYQFNVSVMGRPPVIPASAL